jgi:hypothetical protein
MFIKLPLDKELARKLSDSFILTMELLPQVLIDAREKIPEKDYLHIRTSIGRIIGLMDDEIFRNVWDQYPEFKPKELTS